MNRKRLWTILGIVGGVVVLTVVVLALLGPTVGNTFSEVTNALPAEYDAAQPQIMATGAASRAVASEEMAPMEPGVGGGGAGLNQQALQQQRLIIRTADISLVVIDTRETIDAISQMTDGMGGFVVNSNTYAAGEGALYGDITVRVPADRFDQALDQLRGMAVRVERESISGEDVTEEYVDLQARLESLKTAEQRLLDIMANAQNTSDLLEAEAQLTSRQAEIESIQGRIQYLEQSAAMSRISVNLTPDVVAQPVEVGWRPLSTVRRAFDALLKALTGIVDALIFIVIAVLPPLLVIALLAAPFYFVGRAIWRRRRRSQ